jgi:hypothetical protein
MVAGLTSPSLAASAPLPADQIAPILAAIVEGRDPAFGATVAPALSTDKALPRAERARAVVNRIAQEVADVAAAFAAAPAAQKTAATRQAVARVSAETARDGAERSFEGDGPSLSLMRQLLFVPAQGDNAVDKVMRIVSQFEHSPKTEDNYYEYANPADLKGSATADLPGSAASWTSAARPPMALDQVYAMKKCRHIVILGWFCNTSLYQVRALGGAQFLLTFLHALPKGADNPVFDGGRAENTVDGYDALCVVVASESLILVYDLGVQSKEGAASQQSRLNEGHKAEYRQLVGRIEAALGIPKLPF